MCSASCESIDVSVQAYTASRVNQELAKEGIPLPFGNRLWATNWPTQRAPFPGLLVHLITTVIVIVAPPLSVAYPFILDVAGYPDQIINLVYSISAGRSLVCPDRSKCGFL
ncbi:hypothetical protein BJV77DRAFT_472321 [Russula vinacea]|nr:hypothetical protein BJV77DRAFT_472321 [Russula vinacea]